MYIGEMYLVLGTAQLGLKSYGINNHDGQPNEDLAINLIQQCLQNGVTHFDTARAYGTSETILGKCRQSLREKSYIYTKLDPNAITPSQAEESVKQSLQHLNCNGKPLQALYLHRHTQYQTEVWAYLVHLKRQGIIQELGISYPVYGDMPNMLNMSNVSDPVMDSLLDPDVTLIQVPYSIADQRWKPVVTEAHSLRSTPLRVHVRSIYLQGLLISDIPSISSREPRPVEFETVRIYDLKPLRERMNQMVEKNGLTNTRELCWSHVIGQSWIDGIIVGAEKWSQMEENIRLFLHSKPLVDELDMSDMLDMLNMLNMLNILDPSRWVYSGLP